jgi:hypothetical protein
MDKFEPQGDAEEWVKRINAAHGATFDEGTGMDKKWDSFMSLNMAMYTPSLDLHLAKWSESGQKFRAHWYKNPSDGETMYMIATFNPTNGNVMEIHGTSVNSDNLAAMFTEAPKDVCSLAMSTGHTKANLMSQWQDSVDIRHDTGNAELPYSVVVKISHPTTDAHSVRSWMSENALLDLTVTDSADGNCRVASVKIEKYLDVGSATLTYVEDTRAAYKEESKEVSKFIKHITDVHDERMGTQRGWDRWMDNHVGLVYFDTNLDDLAPKLVENDVKFRAFRDVYKTDNFCDGTASMSEEALCGSIWTVGTSGLSVEMHSLFGADHKFFTGAFAPTFMDFCNGETDHGTTNMYTDDASQSDW